MANDFSSLDRLMELGLSMAVAQQMMSTMNQSLDSMKVPGAGNAMHKPEVAYLVVVDGAQAGPFDATQLEELVRAGRVGADTLMWKGGMPSWKYAREIPEINKLFLLFPSK